MKPIRVGRADNVLLNIRRTEVKPLLAALREYLVAYGGQVPEGDRDAVQEVYDRLRRMGETRQ